MNRAPAAAPLQIDICQVKPFAPGMTERFRAAPELALDLGAAALPQNRNELNRTRLGRTCQLHIKLMGRFVVG